MDKSLIAEYIQAGVRILSAMEFVIRPFFDVNCMVNLQELWYHNSCSLLLCLVKFMLPAEVKALIASALYSLNVATVFTFYFCYEAERTPNGKKNDNLNAGGQISLSCHKEVIKLTN